MLIGPREGIQDYSGIFQGCLDAIRNGEPCAKGILRIARGRYLIGETLRLGDGTRLEFDEGAELLMEMSKAGCILFTNADHVGGNRGISIRGGSFAGGILLRNCVDFTLESFAIRNDGYAITLDGAEDFLVSRIHIDQRGERRVNQDGVHVFGPACRGIIREISGTAWDDMVALNADDNDGIHGPISDILIDGVHCDRTYNFVRLMSRGSVVTRIRIRDIRGTSTVNGGFVIGAHRFDPRASGFGEISLDDIDIAYANAIDDYATLRLNGNIESLRISRLRRRDAYPSALLSIYAGVRIGKLELENIERILVVPESQVGTSTLAGETAPLGEVFAGSYAPSLMKVDGEIGELCARNVVSRIAIGNQASGA